MSTDYTGRGALTDAIQEVAKKKLGREISLRELRLIPYIDFTMKNSQKLDIAHISEEERGVLTTWRKAGWIEGGASGLSITKDFYDAIQEILWLGYVAYGESV